MNGGRLLHAGYYRFVVNNQDLLRQTSRFGSFVRGVVMASLGARLELSLTTSAGSASTSRLVQDGQANRSQELVNSQGRAAIAPAPFSRIGFAPRPPLHKAPIQGHSNGPVPCERSLEMLVERLAIASDDDQLLDLLRLLVVLPRCRRAPIKASRATR